MRIDYACTVSIGIRDCNDDRALIDGQILNNASCSGCFDVPAIAAVCDGCGGYAGGGIAAETVLRTLAAEDPAALLNPEKLAACLDIANEHLEQMKHIHPELSEMCSTVVGIVFGNDSSTVFHLGDSRLYRYDGYTLARLTSDHSAVQRMVDYGYITREEARTYPGRNHIEGCMGRNLRPPEIQPGLSPAYAGDVYLLCSDGVWEAVTEKKIKEILSSGLTCQEMEEQLVRIALAEGSDDNITALVCSTGVIERKSPVLEFILD